MSVHRPPALSRFCFMLMIEVRNECSRRGAVALVTGGTDGIGGRGAAARPWGDRVLFVGRSAERGAQVLAALQEARPAVDHVFLPADLSLLAETARVAARWRGTPTGWTRRCSAPAFYPRCGVDGRGLERNFVLNYLTRYLLARRCCLP